MSLSHVDEPIRLSFSNDESVCFTIEIDRLQATSVVCKVAGNQPNRGEIRDLIQGNASKVVDAQTLGRGYYQLEFETLYMASRILAWNPLALRAARVYFGS